MRERASNYLLFLFFHAFYLYFNSFFLCYCLILYLFQVTFFACSFLSWGARDSRLFSVERLIIFVSVAIWERVYLLLFLCMCWFVCFLLFSWSSSGYSFASSYTIPFENVGFTCMLTRDFCVLSLHSIRLLSSPCLRALTYSSVHWTGHIEFWCSNTRSIVVVHFVQISHSDRDSILNWARERERAYGLVVYLI